MPLAPRIAPIARIGMFALTLFLGLAPSGACAAKGAATQTPAETPSRVRVTSAAEPGTPLVVRVHIVDAATKRPIPGAKLFVYQTDHAGYYDRGEDGQERGPKGSRLRATGASDAAGTIVFDTVVPGSYPGSGIFRHIHYTLSAPGYATSHQEIILDESPRPTEEQKKWAARNGDLVARREAGKDGRSEMRVTLTLQPAKEG